jgi:hypothetical protein
VMNQMVRHVHVVARFADIHISCNVLTTLVKSRGYRIKELVL